MYPLSHWSRGPVVKRANTIYYWNALLILAHKAILLMKHFNIKTRTSNMKVTRLVLAVASALLILLYGLTSSGIMISKVSAQTGLFGRLTPAEQEMARISWAYFTENTNLTGFANSVAGYPSATLWEQGNLAAALIAVRQFGLVSEEEFNARMNQLLTGLSELELFEGSLPNKAYNTETGVMSDYGNNPVERGIGISALDLGRLINALFVVKTHAPEYGEWIDGILGSWGLDRMYRDADLFGAVVLPDDTTLEVQEGRHGYAEYAARSGLLLNRDVSQALNPPTVEVDVYGIPIKNDTRHFEELNAIAYTVTEAPALEIIELGVAGRPEVLNEYCSLYAVQKRRWQETGLLTAITEDHITSRLFPDTPFLYSTIVGDGIPWAVVTEQNARFDERRTLSTKAAVLLRALQPEDDPDQYGQLVFDAVQPLFNQSGYFAGQFEENDEINDVLTNNTNAIVLETLLAKARGESLITGEPLPTTCGSVLLQSSLSPDDTSLGQEASGSASPISTVEQEPSEITGAALAPEATGELALGPQSQPEQDSQGNLSAISPAPSLSLSQSGATASPISAIACEPSLALSPHVTELAPIAPLGTPQPSQCAQPELSSVDRRYARSAWQYFRANADPTTGLVASRERYGATTFWGIGDSLAALNVAHALGIIDNREFDLRLRQVLGTLKALPVAEYLPHYAYSITTGAAVDLGGNPQQPDEWDATGIARVMVALAGVSRCHPEYQDTIADVLLGWRYFALHHQGQLYSGHLGEDPHLECSLYGAYNTLGLKLWGFPVEEVAWEQASLSGQDFPVGCDQLLTSDPLLYTALELGLTPEWDSVVQNLWHAQQTQPDITGLATVEIRQTPYIVHNAAWAGIPWVTVGIDGQEYPDRAAVSTGAAFAWAALFPEDAAAQALQASVTDLGSELLGFSDGYYTKTGETVGMRTAKGNFLALASLYYQSGGPLVSSFEPASVWANRGWWIGG